MHVLVVTPTRLPRSLLIGWGLIVLPSDADICNLSQSTHRLRFHVQDYAIDRKKKGAKWNW